MSDERIQPAELTRDRILELSSPHFTGDDVAIVTGAGSGIGRATAIALAANDLTVVGLDIDEDGLEATESKAAELDVPGTIHSSAGDLTNEDDVAAAVDAAAELGDVRFVANIAGLQYISPIAEFPIEKYDQMQDVMVRGPFLLSKLAIPHIQATDDGIGAIGNMASVHGHYVTRDKASYNISKFALRGLTQSIAAEGEGKLRSFSVSVGYVKTPLVVNQIADTAEERNITEREVVEDVMLGQARTKEMMEPVEVANLFTFGFSQYAKQLNGGDLLFDGGYALTYE